MSHHHSHLLSAIKIIENIKQGEPLVHQLKKFFAADKKYGSKDRKNISALCYNFYRVGNALSHKTTEERILAGTFLCEHKSNPFLAAVAPVLNEKIQQPFNNKLAFLKISPTEIFSFTNELGEDIDAEKFALSFLKQPSFFIRIRPGKEVMLLEKLTNHKIDFEEVNTSCLALPQGFKTESLMQINKEVVVQDRNSQRVFDYLKKPEVFLQKDIEVWDCCAASGGKSILLYDILHGHVQLNVSDVRASILNNLCTRFKEAGIKKYDAFTADLLKENTSLPQKKYDLIICDAPCTGSGTWARTPEQLSFFTLKNIDEYAGMQKQIASTAIQSLKKDGLFFYITCSVFKKENEEVVAYLQQKFHLQILQMEYLKGYEVGADSMFVAVLSY